MDKQRLALSYIASHAGIFRGARLSQSYSFSTHSASHFDWLLIQLDKTNCTFYHLSIFFTTDFKLLLQGGGASRI